MSVEIKVELESGKLTEALGKLTSEFMKRGERAVDIACKETAEYIRKSYSGSLKGFTDQTGQLRRSIRGGVSNVTEQEIEGFVSAGDDRVGSDGKPTKDYVFAVEFPFIRKTSKRDTAFLIPGTEESINRILKTIRKQLKFETLSEQFQEEKFESFEGEGL